MGTHRALSISDLSQTKIGEAVSQLIHSAFLILSIGVTLCRGNLEDSVIQHKLTAHRSPGTRCCSAGFALPRHGRIMERIRRHRAAGARLRLGTDGAWGKMTMDSPLVGETMHTAKFDAEDDDQDPTRTHATSWLDTLRYGSGLNGTNGAKGECRISSSRSGMLVSSRFGYWSSWLHTGSSGSGSSV